MRFLLINQYYPPDVAPTGQLLHALARALTDQGHEVTVLCSRRSYEGKSRYPATDQRDGVRVERLRALGFGRRTGVGRVMDYASFLLACTHRLLWAHPRPDVVLTLTTPPYAGLPARMIGAWRRWTRIHWLMDIYPDVLLAQGRLRESGWLYRGLDRLTRWEWSGSALILCPGPDLLDRVQKRLKPTASETALAWLPLWSNAGARPPTDAERAYERAQRGWAESDFVVMYSGNMGKGHRLGEFLEAARRTAGQPALRWIFSGGGSRRREIEQFIAENPTAPVELHPYVPWTSLAAHLGAADVHLVSLDHRWEGCILPCKLQGIFAAGRPAILVGGDHSSLADWIRESGGGWQVAEDDLPGLLAALEEARDPAENRRRGARAQAFASTHFDAARNSATLAMWIIEAAQRNRHVTGGEPPVRSRPSAGEPGGAGNRGERAAAEDESNASH